MLGIRGSLYDPDDLTWAREQGVTIITIDDYYQMGFESVIKKIVNYQKRKLSAY